MRVGFSSPSTSTRNSSPLLISTGLRPGRHTAHLPEGCICRVPSGYARRPVQRSGRSCFQPLRLRTCSRPLGFRLAYLCAPILGMTRSPHTSSLVHQHPLLADLIGAGRGNSKSVGGPCQVAVVDSATRKPRLGAIAETGQLKRASSSPEARAECSSRRIRPSRKVPSSFSTSSAVGVARAISGGTGTAWEGSGCLIPRSAVATAAALPFRKVRSACFDLAAPAGCRPSGRPIHTVPARRRPTASDLPHIRQKVRSEPPPILTIGSDLLMTRSHFDHAPRSASSTRISAEHR
jgi:hypothetical protein